MYIKVCSYAPQEVELAMIRLLVFLYNLYTDTKQTRSTNVTKQINFYLLLLSATYASSFPFFLPMVHESLLDFLGLLFLPLSPE